MDGGKQTLGLATLKDIFYSCDVFEGAEKTHSADISARETKEALGPSSLLGRVLSQTRPSRSSSSIPPSTRHPRGRGLRSLILKYRIPFQFRYNFPNAISLHILPSSSAVEFHLTNIKRHKYNIPRNADSSFQYSFIHYYFLHQNHLKLV